MVNQRDTPPYRTLTGEPLYGGVTVLADSSEPEIRRAAGGIAAGGEAVSSEVNQGDTDGVATESVAHRNQGHCSDPTGALERFAVVCGGP